MTTASPTSIFLKEYLKDPKMIGSVVPDSAPCVRSLLRNVPFTSARTIIEFGSASGSVTREILKHKNEDSLLLCFEKNDRFFRFLRETVQGSNVVVTSENVMKAESTFTRHNVPRGSVDCIVSTLPCSNLEYDTIMSRIVLPWLRKDGLFVQYMHVLSYLKGFPSRGFCAGISIESKQTSFSQIFLQRLCTIAGLQKFLQEDPYE